MSRSVRSRVQRELAWKKWANSGMASLNDIYRRGHTQDADATTSLNQRICQRQLGEFYKDFPPPPSTTAAEAFHELCGALPGYADVPSARAPFKRGRVSLPPLSMTFANATDFLDGAALDAWSNWRKVLLRSPAELQE